MPQHASNRSRLRALFVSLVAFALVATIAASWSRPIPGRSDAAAPARPRDVDAIAEAERSALTPVDRSPAELDASSPTTAAPPPTFEQRVERLVDIGSRTAELAQSDDVDAATASDADARREFAALLEAFADAGERAIVMLSAGAAEGGVTEPRATARAFVLQLVIAAESARRHSAAVAAGDHSRLDPLVQSLLDVMPQATPIAEVGERVLAEQPFLRATHEASVLGLVQLAADGRFARPVATRLLLTLWDNLQRSGERSPDELSRVAMSLLADTDPSKRTAACRQLLGDPRYRSMVLAWLREHGDRAVAADLSGVAARELEPAAALAVLRELAPLLHRSPSAYLVLGARAPALLADSYRELLATNTQPGVRTDLVAGIGFAAAPASLEIAELALQNDPSPEVRIQAAFAMSASGDLERGERAISQLLDDPAIARDGHRLGALVLAMQNLEAGGGINAIDRLAQRLRTMPLSETGRQQLEALIARSVPGGRVSSGPPGWAPAWPPSPATR